MSVKINPKNERLKRDFFIYLKEAEGKAPSTIDAIRKALCRFEDYTSYRDFSTFNKEQAIQFKKHLIKQKAIRSNITLSLSTVHTTLNALKEFFRWLSQKQGYKSKIDPLQINYLNLSEKETSIAKAPAIRKHPSMEQLRKALFGFDLKTDIDHRNQAVMALIALTGIRDSAAASLRLKHIDLENKRVIQNPDQVKTKFSKQIISYFLPVGDDIWQILYNWVTYLTTEKLYGPDDPLFPQTDVKQDANANFAVVGLVAKPWASAAPIRQIFKEAFKRVGLEYFQPHSLRHTLTTFGQRVCKTPEDFKAWSQNLGHENVGTTFSSYGRVSPERQGEIIGTLGLTANAVSDKKLDQILHLLGKAP